MKNQDAIEDDKELILKIVCEGGGESIYGRKVEDEWIFWAEGGTIDADSDTDWRTWETPKTATFMELLPKDWTIFHPMFIHPDFIALLRQAYDEEITTLPPEDLEWNEHRKQRWDKVLQR